jgi:hypothetical protein
MQAVEAIVEELKKISKKVSNRKEIAQVETVSANWDTTIGDTIADAMDKVGKDGTIMVEEAKGIETTLEVVEGWPPVARYRLVRQSSLGLSRYTGRMDCISAKKPLGLTI